MKNKNKKNSKLYSKVQYSSHWMLLKFAEFHQAHLVGNISFSMAYKNQHKTKTAGTEVLHACYQEAFHIMWQKQYLRGIGFFTTILSALLIVLFKNDCSKHGLTAVCLCLRVSPHPSSHTRVFSHVFLCLGNIKK